MNKIESLKALKMKRYIVSIMLIFALIIINEAAAEVTPIFSTSVAGSDYIGGSDRATGYNMSNKIVRVGDKTHVAFLCYDFVGKTNKVYVRTLDHKTKQWSEAYYVDDVYDNDGGPAMIADSMGYLHIVYGGHGNHLERLYYKHSSSPNDASLWTYKEKIPCFSTAAYPSLAIDSYDKLHLVARGNSKVSGVWLWNKSAIYWQRPYNGSWSNGSWSPPIILAVENNANSRYVISSNNSISVDNQNNLHVAITFFKLGGRGNIRKASYAKSIDGGNTWLKSNGEPYALPITINNAEDIIGEEITGAEDEGWFPYYFPANPAEAPDYMGVPANKFNAGRFVLDPPAGKRGFARARDGHFYFDDNTRAKFWGTNLVFSACFPDHEQAEIMANRIAFFGFNAVRLHHMDMRFEPNGISEEKDGQTGHLSPSQLDKLDYLIYQLKQRGIYININLLVSRYFTEADGVVDAGELGRAAKPVSLFDARLIELQKQYAKDLLTHYNPYTGLRYCDDPAICLVEITNENTLTGFDINSTTEYYRGELNRLYEEWRMENTDSPDFKKFLVYLEERYLKEMKDFLRNEIGIKCPIGVGGHWKWEQLGIQARALDYIDRHAYWDHPRFPNRAWDMNDFRIHNESLLADNYLGIIGPLLSAKRREPNMPFVVSEWNHCYPNQYAYETPMLLASKAKENDWDALFQFAWSHSTTDLTNYDNINNYFNINSNAQQLILCSLGSRIFLCDIVSEDEITQDCAIIKVGTHTIKVGPIKNTDSGWNSDGKFDWGDPPTLLNAEHIIGEGIAGRVCNITSDSNGWPHILIIRYYCDDTSKIIHAWRDNTKWILNILPDPPMPELMIFNAMITIDNNDGLHIYAEYGKKCPENKTKYQMNGAIYHYFSADNGQSWQCEKISDTDYGNGLPNVEQKPQHNDIRVIWTKGGTLGSPPTGPPKQLTEVCFYSDTKGRGIWPTPAEIREGRYKLHSYYTKNKGL